jgi:hypothetical protein
VVADLALNVTERADLRIDSFLPSTTHSGDTSETEITPRDISQPQQEQQEETREEHTALGAETRKVVGQMADLTSKVRRRLYARAMGKLQNIQFRGQETVERLRNNSIDLLNYARYELNEDESETVNDGDDELESDTEGSMEKEKENEADKDAMVALPESRARLFEHRHPLAVFAVRVPLRTTGNSVRAVIRKVHNARELCSENINYARNGVSEAYTGLKETGHRVLEQPYVRDANAWGTAKAHALKQRACVLAKPAVDIVKPLASHAPAFAQPYIATALHFLEPEQQQQQQQQQQPVVQE